MRDKDLWWRPVLVSDNDSIRCSLMEALRRRIAVPEEALLSNYDDVSTILKVVQASAANILLIDVSGHEDRALTLIRELAQSGLTLVALHTTNNPTLILRCIRSGAHEFLPDPFDGDAIWETLDDLAGRRSKNGAEPRGSVYAIFPSKPNLGSTTIATNLAVRARAASSGGVLLADLDPLYASIGFHLKVKSSYTFLDAFSNWEKMDRQLWSNLVVSYSDIDILTAPEESGICEFGSPSAVDFLDLIRKYYPVAFLDCPGLTTPWYKQLAAAADKVILVTTNEFTALHTAKRSLLTLSASGIDSAKIRLVVNRYDPERGLPIKEIESALRTSVFHTLPNDYETVQKAIVDGRPTDSSSRLGKGLDELWKRLAKKTAAPEPARSWWSTFSSKR